MQAIEAIAKTREYLDYVERHINNVARAWGEVMEVSVTIRAGRHRRLSSPV